LTRWERGQPGSRAGDRHASADAWPGWMGRSNAFDQPAPGDHSGSRPCRQPADRGARRRWRRWPHWWTLASRRGVAVWGPGGCRVRSSSLDQRTRWVSQGFPGRRVLSVALTGVRRARRFFRCARLGERLVRGCVGVGVGVAPRLSNPFDTSCSAGSPLIGASAGATPGPRAMCVERVRHTGGVTVRLPDASDDAWPPVERVRPAHLPRRAPLPRPVELARPAYKMGVTGFPRPARAERCRGRDSGPPHPRVRGRVARSAPGPSLSRGRSRSRCGRRSSRQARSAESAAPDRAPTAGRAGTTPACRLP